MSKPPIDTGDVEDDWARLAQRARYLRKTAKMSQKALAQAAGMSTSFVSDIEAKESNPSVVTIFRLARAMGYPPSLFFTDEEPLARTGTGVS